MRLTPHARVIAFFLFAFGAGGVVQPFLNIYLVEVGFSGTQVGVLQGYTSLVIVLVTPFIGWLADRTQRHRLLLGVIVAVKGLSAPALLLSSAWIWLATVVSMRVMAAGTQDALMNRLTMAHLKQRGSTNFGSIRFWGALAFAATSLLAGWLARDGSVGVLFPLSGILGILAAFCVTGFPKRIAPRSTSGLMPIPGRRSPTLLTLFTLIFFLSLGRSAYETFASIHIKTALGANNAWIGLLGAVGSLAPLGAFAASNWLIQRWGPVGLLSVGIALSALAYASLAIAPSVVWTLPVVLFHSLGAALILVSMVILLSQLGHPGQAATDQMLAQLTIPGLAGLVAQPVSGWVLDTWGGSVLFSAASLSGLAALILLYTKNFIPTRNS